MLITIASHAASCFSRHHHFHPFTASHSSVNTSPITPRKEHSAVTTPLPSPLHPFTRHVMSFSRARTNAEVSRILVGNQTAHETTEPVNCAAVKRTFTNSVAGRPHGRQGPHNFPPCRRGMHYSPSLATADLGLQALKGVDRKNYVPSDWAAYEDSPQ